MEVSSGHTHPLRNGKGLFLQPLLHSISCYRISQSPLHLITGLIRHQLIPEPTGIESTIAGRFIYSRSFRAKPAHCAERLTNLNPYSPFPCTNYSWTIFQRNDPGSKFHRDRHNSSESI
ncbi:hypothetical protein BHM03_00061634 [Ensete ventricosum]|nr:hypothetical protein BHM03_00061634 [Ensete ventricosum]